MTILTFGNAGCTFFLLTLPVVSERFLSLSWLILRKLLTLGAHGQGLIVVTISVCLSVMKCGTLFERRSNSKN